ncbi:MAG TPA: universal stress protein [Acidiferrobacteraceae bacterium]|nr:universal stress protein [Acidiferrobacteraceae bacterium]
MATGANNYRHILLATDFGNHAEAIGIRAITMAKQHGARLGLIHVVDYVPTDLPNDLIELPQLKIEDHLVDSAHKRLEEFASLVNADYADMWVEIGSTRHEILRIAEEEDVDLIILGSHGRSGLALLLGSTANGVLHGAPCDVLAVRVKE